MRSNKGNERGAQCYILQTSMDNRRKQMRKWQQDLGQGDTSSQARASPSLVGFEVPEEIPETGDSAPINTPERTPETISHTKKLLRAEKPKEGIKIILTKYHYALIVFFSSLVLLCLLKPFFVQTTQKDRAYESPNLSFVTAFILSALVALGYLLVCD